MLPSAALRTNFFSPPFFPPFSSPPHLSPFCFFPFLHFFPFFEYNLTAFLPYLFSILLKKRYIAMWNDTLYTEFKKHGCKNFGS